MTPDIATVIDDCDAAQDELLAVLGRLDDRSLRAASVLPDWSRAHVLAHVANVAEGAARQVEYAARGELVDFYDGGREGRNAAIEETAALSMDQLSARSAAAFQRLSGVWPAVGAPLWDQRVRYRAGTVADVLLTWWREARIHLVDLDVGVGTDSWSDDLCWHLLDFLTPRLPGDTPVEVRADGKPAWTAPNDASSVTPLIIEGELREVTCWLAGRTPSRAPVATRDGRPGELPGLLPWPSPRQ